MTPLWTSAEIAAATAGAATAPFEATGVSIDTRTLAPGDLFVALKDARDGHDFAANAFAAGASGALVSRPVGGGHYVQVDDVLPALTAMGLQARDRAVQARRCAVTGSVGKTSVKEMLAQIFRAAGPAHWSAASFNNHWGVPLTLARMPQDTLNAVFEIGMSTPGEIAPRSKMVQPHVGLITKIAPAHLEGVGSIEGVAQEKGEIFAGLRPDGCAVLPADDAFFGFLSERAKAAQPGCEILPFGTATSSASIVMDYQTDGVASSVHLRCFDEPVRVELNAVGEHWAINAAAAVLAASADGRISAKDAGEALCGYGPPPGRGVAQTLSLPSGGSFTLIDDAYNANPESMAAALAALAARPGRRKLAALGEMLEIGPESAAAHAGLARPIQAANVGEVFLAGAAMAALSDVLPGTIQQHHAVKAAQLQEIVKNRLTDGDVVLIKGSNASGMKGLADELRRWSAAAVGSVMEHGAERAGQGD